MEPLPPWLDLDERQAERWTLDVAASLASPIHPAKIDIRLGDIATHGCLVRIAGGIALGRYVAVTLPGSITVEGGIAWSNGDYAGLEFIHPLPMAVVKLIARGAAI